MKTRQNVRNLLCPKILDTLGGRRKKHSVFAKKFVEKKFSNECHFVLEIQNADLCSIVLFFSFSFWWMGKKLSD